MIRLKVRSIIIIIIIIRFVKRQNVRMPHRDATQRNALSVNTLGLLNVFDSVPRDAVIEHIECLRAMAALRRVASRCGNRCERTFSLACTAESMAGG